MSEIRVHVITKKSRKFLYLRATNSEAGEQFERSARTTNRKKAQKAAVEWQLELERGIRPELVTWVKFVERYEMEHLSEVSESSRYDVMLTLKMFVEMVAPKRLRDVNEARISSFRKRLKAKYDSTATINKHLRNVRTAIIWATSQKLMPYPPTIKELKVESGTESKGRPVTAEEFDRMVGAAEKTLGAKKGEWLFLLRGLWWSGLRLGEAMNLSWDERHDGLTVDLTGEFPLLRIPAKHQKSRRHELKPIVPEFAELLLSVPEDKRAGFVFNPLAKRNQEDPRVTQGTASRVISELGKQANIVVQQEPKQKFASAHDLRRAFGQRWSRKVMPAVLKDLMRHADINTTMRFYVGGEAEETARMLYGLVTNSTATEVRIN